MTGMRTTMRNRDEKGENGEGRRTRKTMRRMTGTKLMRTKIRRKARNRMRKRRSARGLG